MVAFSYSDPVSALALIIIGAGFLHYFGLKRRTISSLERLKQSKHQLLLPLLSTFAYQSLSLPFAFLPVAHRSMLSCLEELKKHKTCH
jgi:hypothetical protein